MSEEFREKIDEGVEIAIARDELDNVEEALEDALDRIGAVRAYRGGE